jgi:hypothetical protein
VEALAHADPFVRGHILDVLDERLGRRPVVAAVKGWRAANKESPELPFPWNAAFLVREKELADLEVMLRGPTTKATSKMVLQDMYGLVGVSSESDVWELAGIDSLTQSLQSLSSAQGGR